MPNRIAELEHTIKNSPAGPLLEEYLSLRLVPVLKNKDRAQNYETFDKLRTEQFVLENMRHRLTPNTSGDQNDN